MAASSSPLTRNDRAGQPVPGQLETRAGKPDTLSATNDRKDTGMKTHLTLATLAFGITLAAGAAFGADTMAPAKPMAPSNTMAPANSMGTKDSMGTNDAMGTKVKGEAMAPA